MTHLIGLCQKNENPTEQIHNNCTIFAFGKPVMVKNHSSHTFKPKYLLDYVWHPASTRLKYIENQSFLVMW